MRAEAKAKEITQMAKYAIKTKANSEAEGIERVRVGAKATENVAYEVKWNGKGELKTLGLQWFSSNLATEGIETASTREEAKIRGEWERTINKKIW